MVLTTKELDQLLLMLVSAEGTSPFTKQLRARFDTFNASFENNDIDSNDAFMDLFVGLYHHYKQFGKDVKLTDILVNYFTKHHPSIYNAIKMNKFSSDDCITRIDFDDEDTYPTLKGLDTIMVLSFNRELGQFTNVGVFGINHFDISKAEEEDMEYGRWLEQAFVRGGLPVLAPNELYWMPSINDELVVQSNYYSNVHMGGVQTSNYLHELVAPAFIRNAFVKPQSSDSRTHPPFGVQLLLMVDNYPTEGQHKLMYHTFSKDSPEFRYGKVQLGGRYYDYRWNALAGHYDFYDPKKENEISLLNKEVKSLKKQCEKVQKKLDNEIAASDELKSLLEVKKKESSMNDSVTDHIQDENKQLKNRVKDLEFMLSNQTDSPSYNDSLDDVFRKRERLSGLEIYVDEHLLSRDGMDFKVSDAAKTLKTWQKGDVLIFFFEIKIPNTLVDCYEPYKIGGYYIKDIVLDGQYTITLEDRNSKKVRSFSFSYSGGSVEFMEEAFYAFLKDFNLFYDFDLEYFSTIKVCNVTRRFEKFKHIL